MTDLVRPASSLMKSPEPAAFRLYASPDARGGGKRAALIATFSSEQEAREVFRAVRLSSQYRDGWAELVALTGFTEPRRICWFGDDPPPTRSPVPTGRPDKGEMVQTQQNQATLVAAEKRAAVDGRRRSGRAVALVAGFVAVLAIALAALAMAVFGGDDGGVSEPTRPVIPFHVDTNAPPVVPNLSVDG